MKLKCFAILLAGFTLLSFKNSIETVNIFGELKPKKTEIDISGLKIFLKNNDKIIAETVTDSFGKFKLMINPKEEKEFNIFCSGIGNDTLFLKRITDFKNDSLHLKIALPIKHKRKFLGKVVCPICKSCDSVYKLVYINTNPRTITNAEIIKTSNGELLKLPKKEKFKLEKYVPKELSKYTCVKDHINF